MQSIEYHYVTDGPELANFKGLSSAAFEEQVLRLQKVGRGIPEAELLTLAREQAPYPQDVFVHAFDDSLRPAAHSVPAILERHDLQGYFFVNTESLQNRRLGILEKQRILQYSGPDYSLFFDAFCRMALEMYPELPAEAFADTPEHRQTAVEQYYPELSFYEPLERYYRMLRDEYFTASQLNALFEEMFRCNFEEEEWVERLHMDVEDVKELRRRGHVIGAHTHSHPFNLAALCEADQRDEIVRSQTILAEILGEEILMLAYPSNSFSDETVRIARDAGMVCAFTAETTVYSLTDYHRIPRLDAAMLDAFLDGGQRL